MIVNLALALAAAAPALAVTSEDICAQARKDMAAEMQRTIDADFVNHHHMLSKRVADSKSLILGIGDPEDYHPYTVPCPENTNFVRPATGGLSDGEKAYIEQRKPGMDSAAAQMCANHGLPKPARTPSIGMALSGGGYRAMINGLGMTMALMNQSDEASKAGTGGWFDAVTYMTGLSGGSWGTGSFMANDAPLPTDLVSNIWNLQQNLIYPSDGKVAFYTNMYQNVREKAKAGFPTQITDYWALALGEHLLPADYHMDKGANFTITKLRSLDKFQNAQVPYPIIIAAEREKGEVLVAENATVWEFTPHEFGSWAIGFGNLSAGFFTPIEYMGTALSGGQPNGTCYSGFDQLSFIMGTSSTLFNYGIVTLNASGTDSAVTDIMKDILSDIAGDQNDISQIPNPSYQYDYNGTNPLKNYEYVTLVDAGETNQNIPLEPLLMRDIDAILAFDNSADTKYSWPNGSALWTTYQRALAFKQQYNVHDLPLPEIPTTNTFVNEGLNQRPVFFGCNVTDGPLIVYVPHYPWTYNSNATTMTLQYETPHALAQMENSMRSLTLNGTVPTWPKCLSCALTDRANGFTAENRSAECAECFNTWCWNGVSNDTDPTSDYEPVAGITPEFLVKNNLSSDVRDTPITTADKKSGAARLGFSAVAVAAALAGFAML